ncbi:amino acid ABC transporter ATP-binding protein [Malaciobacter molluscorum LMG 25693]|uniref:Amino acid ABC transporter ATP-binding protein n=1 Tax=Malaciobacter molluscorum LMG 25693 TaxID=870501 RepID=A0A2G1DLG8_9BACT|nr:amino acid ABC transporter ATP-binding protein [Malaciobacter molluscorum]AXX92121.1 amino acid ABC transporter, ATP-binding protein [Malaciobacter molluscorum LMG 25693]PHO19348.1 amino acid ABC transporter ATP-binding protein [Malaciobacter molluscorum LMG 25693]
MLQIKHLNVNFGEKQVLKDINLNINKAEVVALIGPSGSGKSTLLRCLNFLVNPTSGEISIDNITVDAKKATKKDIFKLRQKTAMIFQNYNLFKNMTAIENIMEPMITVQKISKNKAESIATDLLKKVGLLNNKDSYPSEMSGGQQQRVGIARAMAVNSDVILFDEPTSSLDPELVGDVLEVIKNLAMEGQKTMLIVTHEMKFAKDIADKIIFLENGIISFEGTSYEVFQECKNQRVSNFVNKMTENIMEVK